MQIILVILTIYFVRITWLNIKELDFTLWAIPGAILLIAVSIRVSGITQNPTTPEETKK